MLGLKVKVQPWTIYAITLFCEQLLGIILGTENKSFLFPLLHQARKTPNLGSMRQFALLPLTCRALSVFGQHIFPFLIFTTFLRLPSQPTHSLVFNNCHTLYCTEAIICASVPSTYLYPQLFLYLFLQFQKNEELSLLFQVTSHLPLPLSSLPFIPKWPSFIIIPSISRIFISVFPLGPSCKE